MKIGVIGCGNLGSSFIKGLITSDVIEPEQITASDPDEEKLKEMKSQGVKTTTDNLEAAEASDVVFLAVKPGLVGDMLEGLKLTEEDLLVSLAAGVSTDFMENHCKARIIRIMPNICAEALEMASGFSLGKKATNKDRKLIESILEKLGSTIEVDENLMNTVTGLSGSGPAYVFLMIKAIQEAGEERGLSEEESLTLTAQTVKGSAELALKSDRELDELIDMVSSPKGTTIEGMKILEKEGVKNSFKRAVRAATERAEELSK